MSEQIRASLLREGDRVITHDEERVVDWARTGMHRRTGQLRTGVFFTGGAVQLCAHDKSFELVERGAAS